MTNQEKAYSIYKQHCRPNAVDIESAVAAGMIAKSDLVHCEFYEGRCRNASVAQWNADTQDFRYTRKKFGSSFVDSAPHPEDDKGFDVFVPMARVDLEQLLEATR